MPDTAELRPGFADPVMDSQRAFRAALTALSRPGRVLPIGVALVAPMPLNAAAAGFCLAMADHDTPVWIAPTLRTADTEAFLRFHCGCPLVTDPGQAAFAIADGRDLPSLDRFAIGDDAYPETSTTVIVQVDALSEDGPLVLSGPGIETVHRLTIIGLRNGVWQEWAQNAGLFPCGVDLVLTQADQLAAIARTTLVRLDDAED